MRRFRAITRVRRVRRAICGVSLIELTLCIAISSIALLIGLVTYDMGWTGIRDIQYANKAYQDAFGVMNSIQEQVQRAKAISLLSGGNAGSYGSVVASPGNTAYSGILLSVPNTNKETDASVATDPLLRAYWLSGNNLMMQWASEGIGPLVVFSDVTAFSVTMQSGSALTNAEVLLSCTCVDGKESISMTTVASRRNN